MKVKFNHEWKLSEAGYFHLFLVAAAIGRDGILISILNFTIAITIKKANTL